jgi:hypothetical protein
MHQKLELQQIDAALHAATVKRLEADLVGQYGLLLTIDHLAALLHREPGGLRWSLSQPSDFAKTMNLARVKIGRRSFYRASDIASIIVGEAVR